MCFRTNVGFPFHPSFGDPSPRTVRVYTSCILDILSHLFVDPNAGLAELRYQGHHSDLRSYRQDFNYRVRTLFFAKDTSLYNTHDNSAMRPRHTETTRMHEECTRATNRCHDAS